MFQPILQENYAFLRQKICLMALMESVFKRSADKRTMSFQTIGEETRLPIDEVEHLVMKALRCVNRPGTEWRTDLRSLKLIKGRIDEVEQRAVISWVQPRVLSRTQIGGLAERLGQWASRLSLVEGRIAAEVPASN